MSEVKLIKPNKVNTQYRPTITGEPKCSAEKYRYRGFLPRPGTRDVRYRDRLDRILGKVLEEKKCPLGPTDWYYRHLVPKDREKNLKYRKRMLKMCYESDELMAEIQMICSRDILFEINTFGWTFAVKDSSRHPVLPFITFPFQDAAIMEIQASLGVEDICMPKSRDLGASWMCLLAMEHRWRYMGDQSFLLASRKKELVSSPGDRKGLIQKLKWYIEMLPYCLQPGMGKAWEACEGDKNPRIINHENGSIFSGEATVENLATGDRRTAILLDEVSKMKNADYIFTSTRDATDCRIFNSTPYGRFGIGEPFYKQVADTPTKKIWMHWTEHPLKAKGLYWKDHNGNKQQFESNWHWSQEYDFDQLTFTGRKPRSTWYDIQCDRENKEQRERKTGQELDLNFNKAGNSVFDDVTVARWIEKAKQIPIEAFGYFAIDPETCVGRWEPGTILEQCPFVLWCPLTFRKNRYFAPHGEFSVGIDIAHGTKGKWSSNSAATVIDRTSRRMVARYMTRDQRPAEWARTCVAICKWFNNALMIPETTGPTGVTFLETITNENLYHNLYIRRVREIGYVSYTDKIGYQNSDKGYSLLTTLADAIDRELVTIPDEQVLREMGQYQYDGQGGIFHASSKRRDASGNEGRGHGDVAIATGCAWLGIREDQIAQVEEKKQQTRSFENLERQPYPCMANRMLDQLKRDRHREDDCRV